MKKLITLGIVVVFIIVCNIQASKEVCLVPTNQMPLPEKSELPEKIFISVVSKGLEHQFWQAVKLGAEKAAHEYGVKLQFDGPGTELEVEQQLSLLQDALSENPEVIILAALDARIVRPYLEQAQAKGIPVIGIDSGVDSPIVKTTVATDNYTASELAADKMAQLLEGKGKVGIIVHDQIGKTALDRRDGFINTLQAKYPDIEILPVQYSEDTVDRTTEMVKDFIIAHPDIKGLFGTNEGTSQVIINAVTALNKEGQIKIIGFDSGKIILDAIRQGIVSGAITQDPVNMGYKAVETAIRAYEGEVLPAFIDTVFAWYDQSNMDTPEIKPLLYE